MYYIVVITSLFASVCQARAFVQPMVTDGIVRSSNTAYVAHVRHKKTGRKMRILVPSHQTFARPVYGRKRNSIQKIQNPYGKAKKGPQTIEQGMERIVEIFKKAAGMVLKNTPKVYEQLKPVMQSAGVHVDESRLPVYITGKKPINPLSKASTAAPAQPTAQQEAQAFQNYLVSRVQADNRLIDILKAEILRGWATQGAQGAQQAAQSAFNQHEPSKSGYVSRLSRPMQ
jgi:hypothetical protein